jgi:hypothetical protein
LPELVWDGWRVANYTKRDMEYKLLKDKNLAAKVKKI